MPYSHKYAHNLKIKVFCKENDDPEEIKISLLTLIPYDDEGLEKEKINLDEEELVFEDGSRMSIFSVYLTKQRHIRRVLEHIIGLFDEKQKNFLIETIDSRLDENMNLYFRLDKDKLNVGECYLTDGGNCFHVRINIAAYPNKFEVTKRIVIDLLKE